MTQKIDLDAYAALAREAKVRADRATPGPWKWWTSCSFRRLTQERRGAKEGGVMYAFRCSDGVSDIQISEADMAFTEASRTDVPALADAVLALVERVRELGSGPVMPEVPSDEVCGHVEDCLTHIFGEVYPSDVNRVWETIRTAMLKEQNAK